MNQTLESHIDLCEQVYTFVLEENRLFKQTGKAPDETFLERKRAFLGQLDESIQRIRQAAAIHTARTPQHRALIDKAQQTVLKTLLLDRENEQLLLKATLTGSRPTQALKPVAGHVQRIYEKHRAT